MEIVSLQTNNTPVALSVSDESGTLLNVTNVTSVSGFSMTVARIQYHDLWLELARLESDANVTITLCFWSTVWILDFVFYPLELVLIPVLLLVYSLYRLARMALIGFSGKRQWKTGRGPASIIVLLILGVACITPLIQGSLHSDFIPMPASQVSRENHALTLNESSSSYSLELADVYPEAAYDIAFKVYNFSTFAYPFSIRISDASEQETTFGVVDNEGHWWLSLTVQTNHSITLTFQRIDTDLELEFTVEASYTIYTIRTNPLIPTSLALTGFGLWALAIGLALGSDWYNWKENHRERLNDSTQSPLPAEFRFVIRY